MPNFPIPTKGQKLMNMTIDKFGSLVHVDRTLHILACIGKPTEYVEGMRYEVTVNFLRKLRIAYIDASVVEYLARLEDDPEFRALQETSRDLADQIRRWHSLENVTTDAAIDAKEGSKERESNPSES